MRGRQGLDAPVGLLHVKDLLVRGEREPLQELARALERVPESMLIDELLERLRKLREHFALVVDEHGTVVGLITLEDILEEIVGEIEDEFDPEEREPMRDGSEGTVIAGWAPVRLVEERLGVEFARPPRGDDRRGRARAPRPAARGGGGGGARRRALRRARRGRRADPGAARVRLDGPSAGD